MIKHILLMLLTNAIKTRSFYLNRKDGKLKQLDIKLDVINKNEESSEYKEAMKWKAVYLTKNVLMPNRIPFSSPPSRKSLTSKSSISKSNSLTHVQHGIPNSIPPL